MHCRIFVLLRDRKRVATCVGFRATLPPFDRTSLQGRTEHRRIPADHLRRCHDLQVPGQKYTFGVVKAAEARGDFEVLAERGRRVCASTSAHDVQLNALGDAQRRHHERRFTEREIGHAAWNDRPRTDGRQHRAALVRHGHECVVFDQNPTGYRRARQQKARWREPISRTLLRQADRSRARSGSCCRRARSPKIRSQRLRRLLEPGDIIIDGGNAFLQGRHPPREDT